MKIYFLFFLLGCGVNVEESLKKDEALIEKNLDDKDENEKTGISGIISSTMNFIMASAHAAPICKSSKSENSNYYVELFELGTQTEDSLKEDSSRVMKLCDADISIDGSYYFDLDQSLLGNSLIKIRVVDNRENPIHRNKEIITYPKNKKFNISKHRTLQAKLIEEEVQKANLGDLRFTIARSLQSYEEEFHEELVDLIIKHNGYLHKLDLPTLLKASYLFKVKIDSFYEKNQHLYPRRTFTEHKKFDDFPASIKDKVEKFEIDESTSRSVVSCFELLSPGSKKYDDQLMICKNLTESLLKTPSYIDI